MQKRNRTHTYALGLAAVLTAALFTSPALSAPIEWVTVGSPDATKDDTGYGAVGYEFQMSKYETTNAQYVEFLNAVADKEDVYGLYSASMGSSVHGGIERQGSVGNYIYSLKTDMGNKPVNYVSFYDTLRFANWLNNGQGVGGDTEDGAYTLAGENPVSVVRNPEANIFLPNEDEWYKAAYYDAVSGSFFDYPTSSNAAVSCEAPGPSAGAGNCLSPGLVDVGSYPNSASPYGTFDQGGNSFEWVHKNPSTGSIQGGSFIQAGNYWPLVSSSFTIGSRLGQDNFIGFRLSSAAVPEPSTGLLLLVGLAGLSKWRRSVV